MQGDFKVNTNKFTVDGSTGNTVAAGWVVGNTFGNSTNGPTFSVDASGNVTTNQLVVPSSVSPAIKVNTDKFTVDGSTGNTSVAGTLGVTGASTITGSLNANGGIAVNTDKFTVNGSTGNTSVKGTLSIGSYPITAPSTLSTAPTSSTQIGYQTTAYNSNTTSANVLTNNNGKVIASVNLTAGIWMITGNATFTSEVNGTFGFNKGVTALRVSISNTTSQDDNFMNKLYFGGVSGNTYAASFNPTVGYSMIAPPRVVVSTGAVTYNLVVSALWVSTGNDALQATNGVCIIQATRIG